MAGLLSLRALLVWLLAAGMLLFVITTAVPTATAGWFTKFAREASESADQIGGKTGRSLTGALDNASAQIEKIDPRNKTPAIAVEATQEGHWRFANMSGETFTAGTPEELQRAIPTLLGERAGAGWGTGKLALYLTSDTAFKFQPELVKLLGNLPGRHALHVVIGAHSYPLRKRTRDERVQFFVQLKTKLYIAATSTQGFKELLWQLGRPLNRANIRMLAFEPGGKKYVPSTPQSARPAVGMKVDSVDPFALVKSMTTIRGQTALVSGRVKAGFLYFKPAGGSQGAIALKKLHDAADAADVNLVILHSRQPRQPGARNWLWLKTTVGGLDDALKSATFGDFLNALGGSRTAIELRVGAHGANRIQIATGPMRGGGGSLDGMSNFWSQLSGTVLSQGLQASLRSSERQRELDLRLLPGISSYIQFMYIGLLFIGLMALPVARSWWRALWPAEKPEGYATRIGYLSAQTVRTGMFALIFTPLVAVFALPVHLARQAWYIVTIPARAWRWISGNRATG